MKVLMISDVYFPRVNGVSTSIQTFRRELAEQGHTVDLVAPAYPHGPAEESHGDEEGIYRVASRQVPFDPEDRMMRSSELRALLPRLRKQDYDRVLIQTPFVAHYSGIDIAAALGVPCVESYHTFFEEYLFHYVPVLPKEFLRGLSRRFSRTQCNRMDALVVPSTPMRDKLAEYGVTVPMHVIPTGIPVARFAGGDGAAFRRKHDIPADRPTLLFVGRVAHEKNIEFLMQAVLRARVRHPGLQFVIAGEGPALEALKRLGERLALQPNLLFVGYLDRATELLDCYRAADAFIFASRTETQGLVLLEAMALGVPVISTAVMGTRDVVGPRRGALVPQDDVADFAAHIVTLLDNPGLRQRLSEDGRSYVREWHADALAHKLVAAWQEVLDARAPARALAA